MGQTVKLFVTSAGNWFMMEIAQIFVEGIQSCGAIAELVIDEIPTTKLDRDTSQVIVAPHEFYPLFLEEKLDPKAVLDLTKSVYLLTVEQPGSQWFEISYKYSNYAKGVFDINQQGVREFRQRGIEAIHTPLGYSPCMEADTLADNAKPVDLLFMGTHSLRREMLLSRNADFFNQYNCRLILTRLDKPRLVGTPGFYTHDDRNRLLASSKIVMNVHFSDNTYLEWHRVLIAIANRCLVVSELSDAIEPLENGKHLILTELENIPEICQYYLDREDERLEIVERAYQFMTQQYSSGLLSQDLLGHLNGRGS